MPTRMFMKLGSGKDAIAGPCREPNHVGWVELESVQLGSSRGMHSAERSDPQGVKEVVITKLVDQASKTIFNLSMYSPALSSVTIDFADATTNLPRLRLQLYQVMVTGLGMSDGGTRPTETVTLGFTSLQWNNNPAADDMLERLKQIFPILQ